MPDIVTRLRRTAGGALGPHHPSLNELEAADEIEMLRATLRDLMRAVEERCGDGRLDDTMESAYRALGKISN